QRARLRRREAELRRALDEGRAVDPTLQQLPFEQRDFHSIRHVRHGHLSTKYCSSERGRYARSSAPRRRPWGQVVPEDDGALHGGQRQTWATTKSPIARRSPAEKACTVKIGSRPANVVS